MNGELIEPDFRRGSIGVQNQHARLGEQKGPNRIEVQLQASSEQRRAVGQCGRIARARPKMRQDVWDAMARFANAVAISAPATPPRHTATRATTPQS